MNEPLFRSVLRREQKRADRLEQHVSLMLVTLEVAPADTRLWRAVADAVALATRQTDVVGWVEQHLVLGAVLPECRSGDAGFVRAIDRRVRRQLATKLDVETLASIRIEVHVPSSREASVNGAGHPVVSSLLMPASAATMMRDRVKRFLDLLISAALLVALSPLFLVIAAILRLKCQGPVLFRQTRVGQMGEPFTILKFRTMRADTDYAVHEAFAKQFIAAGQSVAGPFKMADDPRVTRVGRLLRKTSLDELPQLWNVLRGEMSLVGPRPPVPYEVANYRPWHLRRVLEAKPGITGLWQVAGRSRTTFDAMVRMDLRYARTRSLWADLKILLATPRAVLSCKGAC